VCVLCVAVCCICVRVCVCVCVCMCVCFVCCSMLQCELQCVAVCCSVLQCFIDLLWVRHTSVGIFVSHYLKELIAPIHIRHNATYTNFTKKETKKESKKERKKETDVRLIHNKCMSHCVMYVLVQSFPLRKGKKKDKTDVWLIHNKCVNGRFKHLMCMRPILCIIFRSFFLSCFLSFFGQTSCTNTYVRFHWNCYTPNIHQIQKLPCMNGRVKQVLCIANASYSLYASYTLCMNGRVKHVLCIANASYSLYASYILYNLSFFLSFLLAFFLWGHGLHKYIC